MEKKRAEAQNQGKRVKIGKTGACGNSRGVDLPQRGWTACFLPALLLICPFGFLVVLCEVCVRACL